MPDTTRAADSMVRRTLAALLAFCLSWTAVQGAPSALQRPVERDPRGTAGAAPDPARAPMQPMPGDPAPRGWWGEGVPLRLDAGRSTITLRVYRDGWLARLGHNHLIEVTGLRGTLRRLDTGEGVAELSFRPDRLRVDDPSGRAAAGVDFAAWPDATAIEDTRRNMLGPRVLDAASWPEVRVLARVAELSGATALADIHLSVRGYGRRYRVPVTVGHGDGEVVVAGTLVVRQSELGIRPFSVLGGALEVRDAIEVDFRIIGRNSDAAM